MRPISFINRKAQSVVEYSFVLVIVLSVFIFMETYLKRSIQAGIKISADRLGKQEDAAYSTDQREDGGIYNFTSVSITPPGDPSRRRKEVQVSGKTNVTSYDKRLGYSYSDTKTKDSGWYYVPSGTSSNSTYTLHRYGEENE